MLGVYQDLSFSGPSNFGTGGTNDSGTPTGDVFGFALGSGSTGGAPAIVLPFNYVSNTNLSGSLTFNNTDFASLGIDNTQSYTWTLDANGDTITMQFDGQDVPEPLTILGTLLAGGFGVAMKKRRNQAIQ